MRWGVTDVFDVICHVCTMSRWIDSKLLMRALAAM